MGFITVSLHGKGRENQNAGYAPLRVPVYDNASFEFESSESIENAFLGRKPAHSYTRISNPTVVEFENRLCDMTDGIGCVAFSSGMAAITNVIMGAFQTGDVILTCRELFGNTYSLFEKTLSAWGFKARYVDFRDLESVWKAITPEVKGIFIESIANPQMAVFDLKEIGKLANEHGLLYIVDNTAATPYFFHAKEAGVHIEMLSTTKAISGGATSIGGAIVDYGTFDWSKSTKLAESFKQFGKFVFLNHLRKEVFRNLGSCMAPHTAYLQTLGLETLALRLERSARNALDTAKFLSSRKDRVKHVRFPGLPEDQYYQAAVKNFTGGFGSLLTFDLESREACFQWMNKLKLIRRATNIQDNKTLVIHPHSTIYCEYKEEVKRELGVPDTMIRLSLGIEDFDDLVQDMENAWKD